MPTGKIKWFNASKGFGFIEVEELLFGEGSKLLIDSSEERLKTEFEGVCRTYIPLHAVLRIDDRGVGESTGDQSVATPQVMAGDVLAGIRYLISRDDVDARSIGLIGHSEGAFVAAIANRLGPARSCSRKSTVSGTCQVSLDAISCP